MSCRRRAPTAPDWRATRRFRTRSWYPRAPERRSRGSAEIIEAGSNDSRMTWTAVTVPRRKSGVGMPERCVYCNGPAEQDAVLRARRELSYTKAGLTTTHIDEHLAIE